MRIFWSERNLFFGLVANPYPNFSRSSDWCIRPSSVKRVSNGEICVAFSWWQSRKWCSMIHTTTTRSAIYQRPGPSPSSFDRFEIIQCIVRGSLRVLARQGYDSWRAEELAPGTRKPNLCCNRWIAYPRWAFMSLVIMRYDWRTFFSVTRLRRSRNRRK